MPSDAHVAEEVEHLDVGDDAEGGEEELLEAVGSRGWRLRRRRRRGAGI